MDAHCSLFTAAGTIECFPMMRHSQTEAIRRLDEAAKRGTAAMKANARRFAANVLPIIREIEKAGAASLNAITAKLNERNVPRARGGRWTHVQVGAVLRPFADGAAGVVARHPPMRRW
jgi:hypothetical protein